MSEMFAEVYFLGGLPMDCLGKGPGFDLPNGLDHLVLFPWRVASVVVSGGRVR